MHDIPLYRWRGAILGWLAVALFVLSLSARAQPLKLVAPNGTCPPADQPGKQPDVRDANFGVGYTFVILPGQALYQEAVPTSHALTFKAPEFARARVYAATPDRAARVGRVLVRFEPPINRCGWIDRTALLLPDDQVFDKDGKSVLSRGPRPLKVSEGPSRSYYEGSSLTRKIIVRNVQSRDNNSGTIPVFDKPGGQPSGTVRLLESFDLFKEQASLPADTPEVKQKYFLIGGYDESGHSFLKGWLREEDGLEWNTRIPVSWAGTRQAIGYRDRAMQNDAPGMVVREPPDFVELPDHTVPRFPVLWQFHDSDTFLKQFSKEQDSNTEVRFYEVAMLPSSSGDAKSSWRVASYFFRPGVNGKDVFTYWIALNPQAAIGLVSVANDTCANFRLTSMGDLRHLWEQALGLSSGEQNQYASPADMASKRLAIPAYFLHPLLSKTFDQISEDLNVKAQTDKAGLEDIQKEFCLSAKLISGIRDGVKYDGKKLKWEPDTKSYSGAGVRYNWHYRSDSGVKMLYIPVEYLP